MSFYLFSSGYTNEEKKDTLVVFWIYEFGSVIEDHHLHALRRQIHFYLADRNPLFDRIVFLTSKNNEPQFQSIKQFFIETKLTYTLNLEEMSNGLVFAFFDAKGDVHFNNFKKGREDTIRINILTAGVAKIFNTRGGIIGPSDYFHYILPSGKHSNIFVRSGNILKSGVEISFVSLCILPYLRNGTTNIFCDTSTIIAAAQACVALKKSLNPDFVCPTISSFGSHTGLADFTFEDSPNALFLFSASFAGGIAEAVYEKVQSQTNSNYFVTIFKIPSKNGANGDNKNILGKILFDLSNPAFEFDKKQVAVFPDDCPLCKINNSTAIRLLGDDLLPENRSPKPILISDRYKPKWFDGFFQHFIGRNYVSCHRSKKGGGDIRELYIDLDRLHKKINDSKNRQYKELFYKYLNQRLPASLITIIYLDDAASETIAKQVENYYLSKTKSADRIRLLKYSDSLEFSKTIEKFLKDKSGSVVVVGSSIAQSRTILNISKDLRSIHDMGIELCYFVAVVRTYTADEFKDIKGNLLYGRKFKMDTHSFDSLFEINIPDERYRNITPWQQELQLLVDFFNEEESKGIPKNVLKALKDRLALLTGASEKGLINNLFWTTPKNSPLSINPGFVFFDFNTPKLSSISQADIYFTISIVLHDMRTKKYDSQMPLEQMEYQRKILDPENFARFNDSVIQACILRAAKHIELDYSYDDVASAKMKAFLIDLISKKEGASYEFMLALATEKLKLSTADTKSLLNGLISLDFPIVSGFATIYDVLVRKKTGLPRLNKF